VSAELSSRLIAAHPLDLARLEPSMSAFLSSAEPGPALSGASPSSAPASGAPHASRFALDTAPLTVGELVAFTQFLAREVRAGAHVVDFNADQRWHRRLYRDGRVDVWLISWLPEQGTQLHDHGGSAGSFTVVEGRLSEAVLVRRGRTAGTLRERRHQTGAAVGFDGRHVHDVRNLDQRPAVSVHAYSPPLTSMTFYDLEEGKLVPFAALDTNDPETPSPATRSTPSRSTPARSATQLVPTDVQTADITSIAGGVA
jgi:Cysteine dioxygenase type I